MLALGSQIKYMPQNQQQTAAKPDYRLKVNDRITVITQKLILCDISPQNPIIFKIMSSLSSYDQPQHPFASETF